jgi:hypothetical protein
MTWGHNSTVVLLLLLTDARASTQQQPHCPDGVVVGTTVEGATVCERLDGTGELLFLRGGSSQVQRRVAKRFVPLYTNKSEAYLGFKESQWHTSSGPDVLGNALIARSRGDPSWTFVASAVPPMRYDGGFDAKDPAHGGRGAQAGSHTFVGSRASSVWAVFDTLGTSVGGLGTPDMNQFAGKYGRSTAVFKQPIERERTVEGLWGGWLPIVSFRFTEQGPGGAGSRNTTGTCTPPHCLGCPTARPGQPVPPCQHFPKKCCPPPTPSPPEASRVGAQPLAPSSRARPNEIEWTAVPVEDTSGSIELAVLFRVLHIDVASGTVLDAKYYQTYAYSASGGVPAKGQPAGSKTAQRFYSAVESQQDYWHGTMVREGAMTVDLPLARGTNGQMLANQSLHSIVRDMISRIGAANGTGHSFFPQYGVSGTYSKQANHGFEDTFQASLMMALEWGCFEYAKGLLHNWLSYYLIPDMDDDGFSFTGINCESTYIVVCGLQCV